MLVHRHFQIDLIKMDPEPNFYLQCCPVFVPHIAGIGGPPETINLSSMQT